MKWLPLGAAAVPRSAGLRGRIERRAYQAPMRSIALDVCSELRCAARRLVHPTPTIALCAAARADVWCRPVSPRIP